MIEAIQPADSAGLIPAQRLAEPRRQERADDAEDRGDDEAARILTRHQELRDDADDEADDEGHDDAVTTAEYLHCRAPL